MWRLVWVAGSLALLVIGNVAWGENWPCFRGPTRQGESSERGLPLQWSEKENIRWKTAIPGQGWSSPIVWNDRVYLTTTVDEGRSCHALAVDRRDGKPIWNVKVFTQKTLRKEAKNSYASPTPATDGERVYAVFGGGSIVAVDHDGKIAWTNREVSFYSQHGLGASPVLHGDLLIMPFDGSSSGEDKTVGWKTPWDQALLLAVDKNTGLARWRGRRGSSRIAHVTPNILSGAGTSTLVSGAGDVVQGFDPATGQLIWSCHSQGEGVVPSIVVGEGLVFSASGYEKPHIRAVRPGGKGDVTKTHLVWEQEKGTPALSSFVHVEPHLFAVTEGGVVTCYQAQSGQIVWQERIGGRHSASPVTAEGRIYFLSEEGETTIIDAGATFNVVGRNTINEKCQASLAVSQGEIFLRSEQNLFCIGQPEK